MAGQPKKGLAFAGWNTDIFDNDTKIDQLIDAQGWVGFSVYFFLCQKAYASDGYFYRWSYADCATTARKMGSGIRSETVKAAVGTCSRVGLFDKSLLDVEGILTSRGIQRRYVEATKKRRVRTVNKNYWLLDDEESRGLVIVSENKGYSSANADLQDAKADLRSANDHKSKVKKSKVNNKSINTLIVRSSDKQTSEPDTDPIKETVKKKNSVKKEKEPEADVEAIPLNDGTEWRPTQSLFAEYVRLYPNVDVKRQISVMRSWCISNPNRRKTKRGVTRFVNSWLSREQDKGYRRQGSSYGSSYQREASVGDRSDWYSPELFDRLANENPDDVSRRYGGEGIG